LGSAFEEVCGEDESRWIAFAAAAKQWPFLSNLLHNVEFSVAAGETGIMAEYAALVEDAEVRERLMAQILGEYERTNRALSRFFPGDRAKRRPRLTKAVDIRRNALTRLHREQIVLLREWREATQAGNTEEAERLLPPLLLTVNAIAGGLKTTG
jgi:phosphoenolpyruvate carboxylase